nr:Rieske (2Fe-2S) protein [Granulosicoccus sp.]
MKVDANIREETSDLLAPWTYRSTELFELETELLFKQQWMLAGHCNDIPERGDYLTFDAFDERALVVRGKDGEIRAFHNVCKHRGGKILDQSSGRCPGSLTCPFHGWTYALDGRLQGVPRIDTFRQLDISAVALNSVALEIWLGFIFIRFRTPETSARSVAEQMAPVTSDVMPYKPEQLEPLLPAS